MALDGAGYAQSEFKLALKAESTIGTANVSSMNLINVDSVSLPALNPTQVLDIRSGDGRTAKAADAFTTEKMTTKEIGFSGTADTTVLPLLLQNIVTTAVGSSPASYDIAYNWSPPELQSGAGSSTILNTVTVAIVSPEAGNDHSIIFPGCCLTSLTINGDMGTESGRIKIEGTFKTGFKPSYGQNKPTSMTTHGSTYYYLSDFTTTRTVAGVSNSVISSYSLSLENDAIYQGYTGSDADPEAIIRGVPELAVNMSASVKYDDNTAGLHSTYKSGTTVATELSNHGTWSSASTFGVKASYGKITSVAWSDNAAMFVDVGVKCLAHTSGDLIQIIA